VPISFKFGGSPTEYSFVVSRVRVLETKLLDRPHFDRMIAAPNLDEALRVLNDTIYGRWVSGMPNPYAFGDVLNAALADAYGELAASVPEPGLVAALLLRFDFNNLKVLMKEKLTGVAAPEGSLFAITAFPHDDLVRAMRGEADGLPSELVLAVKTGEETFSRTEDVQQVDFALDRALFAWEAELAKASENQAVRAFWRLTADLKNIISVLRVARLRRAISLDTFILPGGEISREELGTLAGDPGRLSEILKRHGLEGFSQALADTSDLGELERKGEDYIGRFLKDARRNTFGPEPVLAYLWAREIEVKNIRVILTAKVNNLPDKLVDRRVREALV
jgi:V/A-type H+-transporting ATPase subunit C